MNRTIFKFQYFKNKADSEALLLSIFKMLYEQVFELCFRLISVITRVSAILFSSALAAYSLQVIIIPSSTKCYYFIFSYSLAGHSSESKNVCIWDSILPHGKSLVVAFTCHDQGASSLVYAPQHQVLVSTGKKGDVCLVDVRSRSIRHRFQAHEGAVKCVGIDPHEEYFATGSADGDIKVI